MNTLFAKLRDLFRRRNLEAEMAEEMRPVRQAQGPEPVEGQHLERRIQEKLTDGLTPDEARYAAQREFGGVAQVQEQCRDAHRFVWLEQVFQDMGYAVRSLRRNRVFTTTAVATLALGIGATTAIFSIIDAIYLQPLPVKEPSRLMMLVGSRGAGMFSVPNFVDFREQNEVFAGLAASRWVRAELQDGTEKSQIGGLLVSADYFPVFGLDPLVGRTFAAEDLRPSAHPVMILTEAAWRRRFGGDPVTVGRSVRLNGIEFQVIGIAKGGFSIEGAFDREQEMWLPMRPGLFGETQAYADRDFNWVWVHGRLKERISRDMAQAAVDIIARRLEGDHPMNAGFRASVVSEVEWRLRRHPAGFYAMLTALVVCVLVIACSNVANLLLARGLARSREIAVRAALGAGRGRLIRQLLTESLLLAMLGGVAGVLLGHWVLGVFAAALPAGMAGNLPETLHLNGRVLTFTAGLSLLVGVVAGLFPAVRASRPDLIYALHIHRTAGFGGFSFKRSLIVLQVALSVVLLVSTGLFVRTLQRIWQVDFGYRTDRLLWVGLDLRKSKPSEEAARLTFARMLDAVRGQPQVEAVGLGPDPFPSYQWTNVVIDGVRDLNETHHTAAGPGYFAAMGIPLLGGREFNETDHPTGPPVAIINQAMAQRFWPGRNPIGVQFRPSPDRASVEIVGVVATVRETPWRPVEPLFYLSHAQSLLRTATLAIRVRNDPAMARAVFRDQLLTIEPNATVSAATFVDMMQKKLSGTRFRAGGLLVLAAVGVLLASIGLYGVTAYSVAQKTREIGVRLALGASPSQMRAFVISDALRLVLIGAAAGALLSLGATRLLEGLIVGSAFDPPTVLAVAVVLSAVGLISTYMPARRASKVDPMVALRCE